MKRLLWFLIGVVIGAFVIKRVREYLQRRAPEALGNKMAETAGSVGDAATGFADRVRAAMAERESEIRDALGQPQQPEDTPEH